MVEEAISFWTEIQRFEDMLAADPRSLSFAPLSELYRKLGLLDDALSVAKKGCDLHPEYPGGFFALGCACLDKGLKDEARRALEHVIHLSPENLRAQKLLGQLYVEQGEPALARAALEKVLEQNPDDTESSLLLNSLGAPPSPAAEDEEILDDLEIIEDLTELAEEPPEPEVSGFGELEFSEPADFTEPFEPAVPEDSRAAQEAPRHSSRDPLTTATLAELYVSQGFLDKAIAIYQELLSADPANHPYRLRCAELKSALERQLEAGIPAPPASPLEPDEEEAPLPQPTETASPREALSQTSPPLQGEGQGEDGVPPRAPSVPRAQTSPPLQGEGQGGDGGVEAELTQFLENIRRRKHGV